MNAKGVDAAATVLGEGSFGHVARREIGGELVAVKEFRAATRSDALQEVAVSAALTPHPCVIQLLDVLAVGKEVHLVYPLWGQALDKFVEQRRARPPHRGSLEESIHIFKSLLSATRHMHTHGLVHTDIKPPNMLVKGCDWIGGPNLEENLQSFGRRLLQLPLKMHVCLADLGSSLAGDPRYRRQVAAASAACELPRPGSGIGRPQLLLPSRLLVPGLRLC